MTLAFSVIRLSILCYVCILCCQFIYIVTIVFVFLETEDFQCKDSGFEGWNYPASSGSSAISSAENFACSRLQYNTSLVDRSKEERFKLDVEVWIY